MWKCTRAQTSCSRAPSVCSTRGRGCPAWCSTHGAALALLGLSPLVSHTIAVVGMIAAIIVALMTAAKTFVRGGQPAGKDETVA